MSFCLSLAVPVAIASEGRVDLEYDAELDDVGSILGDVSRSLAELSDVKFIVAAGNPLPVDVAVDLVVVMEQLTRVLSDLRETGSAKLDLYEQGIETRLIFSVQSHSAKVERRDLLGRPKASNCDISLPSDVLIETLRLLARTFVGAAKRRCPERSAHPWFEAWARSLMEAASP